MSMFAKIFKWFWPNFYDDINEHFLMYDNFDSTGDYSELLYRVTRDLVESTETCKLIVAQLQRANRKICSAYGKVFRRLEKFLNFCGLRCLAALLNTHFKYDLVKPTVERSPTRHEEKISFGVDIIAELYYLGLYHVIEKILCPLEESDLKAAEKVSDVWQEASDTCYLWKKFIERKIREDVSMRRAACELNCMCYFFEVPPNMQTMKNPSYKNVLHHLRLTTTEYEQNWEWVGTRSLQSLMNQAPFIMRVKVKKCYRVHSKTPHFGWPIAGNHSFGHSAKVLCSHVYNGYVYSGSEDREVHVTDRYTGETVNVLCHHTDSVNDLQVGLGVLVTCSADKTLAVWIVQSEQNVTLHTVLLGHEGAVLNVAFDDKYIVSASTDKTVRVWTFETFDHHRTLHGHTGRVISVDVKNDMVASVSSDCHLRLWDANTGTCLRKYDTLCLGVNRIALRSNYLWYECHQKMAYYWRLSDLWNSEIPWKSGTIYSCGFPFQQLRR